MDNSPYMYISNFPHGFFEKQMYGYFSQYGKVKRVHISYDEKTGQSKGYGFVEFEDENVAEIASNSMNGYYMFNHYIECEIKPISDIIEIFGKDVIDYKKHIDGDEMEERRINLELASNLKKEYKIKKEEFFRQCKELIESNTRIIEELKNAGIDYEFDMLNLNKLKEHVHQQQTNIIDKYENLHHNIKENDDLNEEENLYNKIINIHDNNLWKLANIDDDEIDNIINENNDIKRKHSDIIIDEE